MHRRARLRELLAVQVYIGRLRGRLSVRFTTGRLDRA
jgi:hypothetical protein